MAEQWPAAPVGSDEREEAVLDLVPFAGAGRQVTDADGQVVSLHFELRISDFGSVFT